MPDPVEGYVAHRTARRLRVRLPGRRRDVPFFETIRETLAGQPDVAVAINPATASVLIVGDVALATRRAEEAGLFVLRAVPARSAGPDGERRQGRTLIQQGRHALHLVDQGMMRLTGSRDSLRSMMLVGFLGAGVYQLSRGNILGPAITMFWRAGELLEMWGDDPVAEAIAADEMTPSA